MSYSKWLSLFSYSYIPSTKFQSNIDVICLYQYTSQYIEELHTAHTSYATYIPINVILSAHHKVVQFPTYPTPPEI